MVENEQSNVDKIGQVISPGDIVITNGYGGPRIAKVTKIVGNTLRLNNSNGPTKPDKVIVATDLVSQNPEELKKLSHLTVDKVVIPRKYRKTYRLVISSNKSWYDNKDLNITCIVYCDGEVVGRLQDNYIIQNCIYSYGTIKLSCYELGRRISATRLKQVLGFVPNETTIIANNLDILKAREWFENRGVK